MVLEKQDSGISLTPDTTDGKGPESPFDGKSSEYQYCGHELDIQGDDEHDFVPLHKTVCCSLCRRKQARHHARERERTLSSDESHSPSVSEASSMVSARTSRSPWLRDPTADAHPITDPNLRRKLQSARTNSARVTTKRNSAPPMVRASDQKILELLLAKREEEERLRAEREAARLAWEKDRQSREEQKSRTLTRRRHSFSDRQKEREAQKTSPQKTPERQGSQENHKTAREVGRQRPKPDREPNHRERQQNGLPSPQHSHGGASSPADKHRLLSGHDTNQAHAFSIDHRRRGHGASHSHHHHDPHAHNHDHPSHDAQSCSRCSRNHDRQVEVKTVTKKTEETIARERQDTVKHCDKKWQAASQKQLEQKRKEMEEKKRQKEERRKSVEQRLEQQRKEMEEYQASLKQKHHKELRRASSLKESREQEASLRVQLRNYQAQKKHEDKVRRLKQQSVEDLVNLKATVDFKHAVVEHNLDHISSKKEKEVRKQHEELEKRLRQSKDLQTKQQSELNQWQEELQKYRHLQEQRAEDTTKQKIEEKKRRAYQERLQKERLQRENLRRMHEQEDEWKADVEATIAMKDARSKMVQQEREEIIQESRALAATSQILREELRQHYSMNDLDQLNKHVQIEARIGLSSAGSVAGGSKQNVSKVHLG